MDPEAPKVHAQEPPASAFRVGEWTVEPSLNRVTRAGRPVHVRRQLIDLLTLLASRQGEVVSRDEIFQAVWPGQFVAKTGLARCISQLRDALEDDPREPRIIETIPTRGYRLIAPVERLGRPSPAPPGAATAVVATAVAAATDPPAAAAEPTASVTADPATTPPAAAAHGRSGALPRPRRLWPSLAAIVTPLAIGVAVFTAWRSPGTASFGKDDTLLVSFVNRTGDVVFDDTLRLALVIQLEQSPYLRVVSEERVREGLRLMHRPPDEGGAGAVAMDLCQRVGARAALTGSIASLGSRYVIGLEAVECASGRTLVRRQAEAARKEDVIARLGQVASGVRPTLGESVASIEGHDVPLVQATTASLDALRDLTAGDRERRRGRDAEAVAAYQRAVELDPEFALAYGRLGAHLLSLSRTGEAIDALKRAYALRGRTSATERQYITAHYYTNVVRDPFKAVAALEAWRDAYPMQPAPRISLAEKYVVIGRFEEALAEAREALRLEPADATATAIVVDALTGLERLDEARQVAEAEVAAGRGSSATHVALLLIAFAQDDDDGMRAQLDWAAANPAAEPLFASVRAAMAMFGGRMADGDRLWRERVARAEERGDRALASLTAAGAALHEALVGSADEVRALTALALKDPKTPDTVLRAAFALALVGETDAAERRLAEYRAMPDVEPGSDPQYRAPTEALIAIDRGQTDRAVELLAPLKAYEPGFSCVPTYVRGLAYLRVGRPQDAALEFGAITSRRGALGVALTYPLSWLQLARARAAAGDRLGARQSYERFLHFWRDADPDLPALGQARAELKGLLASVVVSGILSHALRAAFLSPETTPVEEEWKPEASKAKETDAPCLVHDAAGGIHGVD